MATNYFVYCSNFTPEKTPPFTKLKKPLDRLAVMCYIVITMNEEETFQYGPFTVTVHPATNEEDEWYEVEES